MQGPENSEEGGFHLQARCGGGGGQGGYRKASREGRADALGMMSALGGEVWKERRASQDRGSGGWVFLPEDEDHGVRGPIPHVLY